ncbi:hypothetical protein CKAN_02031800 [Cinnamomum micranthum f. kanehirae]|uniref:Acetyltransferase n=1 Tax=Cinnamomum micranthum f. kanehirae TaxID=337451 RepID=A0A3S3NA37_9MAGN|nr:hypothetical protein CKAN_02031800 [Cinnamomum micranthum f. kanehirae]
MSLVGVIDSVLPFLSPSILHTYNKTSQKPSSTTLKILSKPMPQSQIRHISRCTITPQYTLEHPQPPKRCELTPWDLSMLSAHYIQKGLLFHPPPSHKHPSNPTIHHLKQSLSKALAHFFPLAGRFKTHHSSSSSSSSSLYVFIDCNDLGVEFIHAAADVTVSDILDPIDVPQIVKSLFVFDGAVNCDGHSISLLAVQVTELIDGIFIGCSFNHAVGDGTSFWHFFNVWSEITRRGGEGGDCISDATVGERWFGDLDLTLVRLPFSRVDDFIERFEAPLLRERIFHFAPESIARLKEKANQACNSNKISSFQALCALVWRSITRARKLPPDQNTNCRLATSNRSRLQPPLSPHYFGNCMQAVAATTTAGQLLSHDLGWAAWMVHQSVFGHTDAIVRGTLDAWVKSPVVYHLSGFDGWSVMMGSSPRFDMYGNDFGWGKPLAVRSGYANKFDGKVTSYPGSEGGGSMDLEICLLPEFMNALELDGEFMDVVSH